MEDAYLTTYLNDHLGGVVAAVELSRRCLSRNGNSELGSFLERLTANFESERELLRKMIRALDRVESPVKILGGWAIEKVTRLKLNNALFRYSDLSRVIELEALLAAAQAQWRMWAVLDASRSGDPRFAGMDFAEAAKKADKMLAEAKRFHREASMKAFRPKEDG